MEVIYTYDGDGNLVSMMKNGEVTLLVGKYYEKQLIGGDKTMRKNDYFGSERVAVRKNDPLTWLLTDQQGSTVATANHKLSSVASFALQIIYLIFGSIEFTQPELE